MNELLKEISFIGLAIISPVVCERRTKKYAQKHEAHWWHAFGTPFDIFDIRYDTFTMHHASCLWVEDIAIDRLLWPFHFYFHVRILHMVCDQEKYWNLCFCLGHNSFDRNENHSKNVILHYSADVFGPQFSDIFGLCTQHNTFNWSSFRNILHLWHDFVSIKISNFFIYGATLFFFSLLFDISHSKMDL